MTRPARRVTTVLLLTGFALCAFSHPSASAKDDARPTTGPSVPAPRSDGDVIGAKLPATAFKHWLNTEGNRPPAGGSVTLYRWWTDTCPFCAASLPAVERLRAKYGPRGLRVVAVYHPKPPREVADEAVLAAAKRIGYAGPVAVDADWSVLKALWLSTGRRAATSASFLVDADGVVRYVHPGPDFFPSDRPDEARQDADYRDLERAIEAPLPEKPTP